MFSILLRFFQFFVTLLAAVGLIACGHENLVASSPSLPPAAEPPVEEEISEVTDVALLLPFGSEDKNNDFLATSLENGARLALSDLNVSGIELKVYPTRGEPVGAVEAANEAIADGARVILGPVFKEATDAIRPIVEEANVIVFSFSNDTSLAGGPVFVLGHNFLNSANRIARYAVASERKKALVVHAVTRQGMKGLDAIRVAAATSGLELAGTVPYEFSQVGVVDSIPRIVEAVEEHEADMILFTADSAGALSLLGQLLPEAGIDPEVVRFAGLTRWDIPASNLVNKGLQGGWFVMPDPNLSASFAYRYQYVFEAAPHTLAGLSYDGIAAISAYLISGDPRMLVSRDGFVGSGGLFRFGEDRIIERALSVAEIRNNKVNVISRTPRSFDAMEASPEPPSSEPAMSDLPDLSLIGNSLPDSLTSG